MKRFWLLILCVAMIMTATACTGGGNTETDPAKTTAGTMAPETTEEPTTEEPTTEAPTKPEPTAEELYDQALALLNAMESMKLEISVESTTVLGTNTFEEKNNQTLILRNIGKETFAAKLSDTTYRGTYYTKTEEVFSDGKMYYSIQQAGRNAGMKYATEMTAQEYLDRMIPAALLEYELYESVEKNGNTLTFSSGIDVEDWLGLYEAEFEKASGSATLGENGELKNLKYSVVYEQNSAVVTMKVSVNVQTDGGSAINVPTNMDGYTVLEGQNYLAPYLVHHAIGYIGQMETVSSYATVAVVSEALGWVYGGNSAGHTYVDDQHMLANLSASVQIMDMNTGEYYLDETLVESYEDGIYTSIYNDGVPESQPLDYAILSNSVKAGLLSEIPDFSAVETIEVGVYSGMILVEYGYDSDTGKTLSTAVAGLMLADPEVLNNAATAYRTEVAGGFIGIDIATGIPTSIGTEYTGIHTIEGAEYGLNYVMSRDFLVGDTSTYKEITGEELPELPDLTKEPIAPLFYKVTGSNGEQMWLFGTIHVGDFRTTQLPEKIKEAFSGADALAVEFDIDAFYEQMEADQNLAMQVYQMYMYTDGTKTKDHFSDLETYDYAVKTMKAIGAIGPYTMQMKASYWGTEIESFYMQWARGLSEGYGVDLRLLHMARNQQKKILDIESATEQLSMLMGFSDGLQELLLAETLSSDATAYGKDIRELYEMWCEGDEAKLIAYLNDSDISDMTPEELVLYEEYVKAMETDRNAKMFEVAKGYLESGDVVFYAVGLAHLLAEDGLVNTLRDAGYTVELVGD